MLSGTTILLIKVSNCRLLGGMIFVKAYLNEIISKFDTAVHNDDIGSALGWRFERALSLEPVAFCIVTDPTFNLSEQLVCGMDLRVNGALENIVIGLCDPEDVRSGLWHESFNGEQGGDSLYRHTIQHGRLRDGGSVAKHAASDLPQGGSHGAFPT
jgi:hypothetical protein